jgi:hypothetical protein
MLALRARVRIPLLTILVSLMVSPLASVLSSPGAVAQTRLAKSPRKRVLVVAANLLEGFNDNDVADMTEIGVFADRLMSQVPYAPDALLVQEVRRKSARYVARVMGEKTGFDYAVLVNAGKDPWRKRDGRILKRDTAIVINADTMEPRGKDGYVVTKHPHKRGDKLQYKYNAYGAAREIGSHMDVPMLSVHIPGYRLRRRAKTFAKRLARAYPSTSRRDAPVIGGDFNDVSPVWLSGELKAKRWWRRLTGNRYRYSDAVFETTKRRGKDYIFAKSGVAAGGIDWSYDARAARGNPARFYSDHRFRWALLR